MSSNKKNAIIIMGFNRPHFITEMIQAIVHNCTDDNFDIIVWDNSPTGYISELPVLREWVLHHFRKDSVLIIEREEINPADHPNKDTNNPSINHGIALGKAYNKYYGQYRRIMFLDHDCFPIAKFSFNDYPCLMSGVLQHKAKIYPWVGCLVIATALGGFLDFGVNEELGLDTGGNLYKQTLLENPNWVQEFSDSKVGYEIDGEIQAVQIIDNKFLHIGNGSNWKCDDSDEARIEKVLNLVRKLNRQI